MSRPPAAQLMVVSWVPMAMRMVSALAWAEAMASARPASVVRKSMGIPLESVVVQTVGKLLRSVKRR